MGMGRWRAALRLIGVGWYIGLCIFLGLWGGWWLDGKTGMTPLWIITGLILGLFIAVYGVFRMLLPIINNRQEKDKD
jgi:F0F1-type ATP synthase assembly protein I